MKYLTQNAKETQALASQIIKLLDKQTPRSGAAVLALVGELGAGKTTFIQGLGRALGIKEKILSPTFVIMKHYKIKNKKIKKSDFYHLDCYRINSEKDLATLGLEEILKNKNNLVVVEWAERVKKALPQKTLWLKFKHGGADKRKIKIN